MIAVNATVSGNNGFKIVLPKIIIRYFLKKINSNYDRMQWVLDLLSYKKRFKGRDDVTTQTV
jgi:hypothetical protein